MFFLLFLESLKPIPQSIDIKTDLHYYRLA
jgi:hypothetical protein